VDLARRGTEHHEGVRDSYASILQVPRDVETGIDEFTTAPVIDEHQRRTDRIVGGRKHLLIVELAREFDRPFPPCHGFVAVAVEHA